MKYQSLDLLQSLTELTEKNIEKAAQFLLKEKEALYYKTTESSWNVLECIEHLNIYGDFYLPEIAQRILKAKNKPGSSFSSGWLGEYFAQSMLPKEKTTKMKTFKKSNPIYKEVSLEVLSTFLVQQQKMLDLLKRAQAVHLGKTRAAISILPIRLKLGDVFRIVIYHNLRHIKQAERVLADFEKNY